MNHVTPTATEIDAAVCRRQPCTRRGEGLAATRRRRCRINHRTTVHMRITMAKSKRTGGHLISEPAPPTPPTCVACRASAPTRCRSRLLEGTRGLKSIEVLHEARHQIAELGEEDTAHVGGIQQVRIKMRVARV